MDMHRKALLTAGMVSLIAVSGLSPAQEQTTNVATAVPSSNVVELGVGYLSDDAYRFGRYSGLTDQGPYLIGNVNAMEYGENAEYWRLRGMNLGLDSRYLRVESGVQGEQAFFLEYDQLPDFENNTGATPFLDPGGTRLILPADFSMENLDGFLLPFDQETERKRLGVGTRLFFKSRWELDGSIQHETKRGTDWIGGSMGPIDEESLMKKTVGMLLPEPIDYEVNKIDTALRYRGKATQMEFAYHGSLFYNNDRSLTWQNPFDTSRTGRISLEPDNQMHQLTASLGHRLSPANRISALLSVSHLTQDQTFLPYSTSTTTESLPRSSLDGEVMLIRGQFKLTSRQSRKLRLSARYSYDERDNKTAQTDYTYFVADGITGLASINPRTNDPLSYRKNRLDLDANYRINSKMSLRGGYSYTHMHRDSDNQERQTTREQTLSAKWKLRATSQLNLALYGEAVKRGGSSYETRPFENPALRNYNLADLRRNKLGSSINYMPSDRLSLGLTAEYTDDDYHDSTLGLTEAQESSVLFNATYQLNEQLSGHAFYNYEQRQSLIAGAQDGKLTTSDWHADFDDRIHSLGLGAQTTGLTDKWDVGADLLYTRSRGTIDMRNTITTITNPDSAAELPTLEQYPDVKSSLTSLQLWTRYRYSDDIAVKFSYWYEDYRTRDWAVDGTVDTFADLEADSAENLLLLGEEGLDYTQHVIGVSLQMKF